ncbi:hypothetical protein CL622_00735 [archaeon]|nr:hypothetical protein [archaeon]
MQIKTYKFRLYPSTQQQKRITKHLYVCKEVHNLVLEQSRKAQVFNRRDLYIIVKDIKTKIILVIITNSR